MSDDLLTSSEVPGVQLMTGLTLVCTPDTGPVSGPRALILISQLESGDQEQHRHNGNITAQISWLIVRNSKQTDKHGI